MVGVSYHELAATSEARPGGKRERHTAGQRKQFLVICVVGVAVLCNSFINAGLLESVIIQNDGIYPGGTFVHKILEEKDYATTGGIWRRISKDLQVQNLTLEQGDDNNEENFDEILYSVYIDNVNQGCGRYFSGILIDNSKKEFEERLLAKNDEIGLVGKSDSTAAEFFQQLKYEVGDLPSVRCAIATFPYTDGFVSALLHNYKVFPALYNYAEKNHDPNSKIIISTTCNRELQQCTHYVPMIQSEKFLMGHLDTAEYMDKKPKVDKYDVEVLLNGLKKLFGLK